MQTPFSVYPRPQMRRDSFFSLNGEWALAFSPLREIPDDFPLTVTVPFPPESSLSGVFQKRKKNELLYYKRVFRLPEGFHKAKTLLHFGAVDQVVTVVLNGSPVATHEGGYLPFSVDITPYLEEENTLVLAVEDTLNHDYPYGKQRVKRGGMWYTPVSGVWQSVWLESYPEGGIYDVRVSGDDASVTVTVESDAKEVTLSYLDGETEKTLSFCGSVTITPESRRLWSPDAPNLYPFTVKTASDEAHSYFALRKLEAKKCGVHTRFHLNGKPIFLHGVLDQGYFPDGIYLPESPEEYERDVLRTKALGFNMTRKHIKVEPALFYEACDRLGLIVCQDAVNNGAYSFFWHTALPTVGMKRFPNFLHRKSRRAKDIFLSHARDTLDYVSRFPSVLLFTIFNEGWGQKDEDAVYDVLKAEKPEMLFDTASGWFKTDKTDMRSDHVYFKRVKPDYKGETKPVFLSEFGGYSLPLAGHIFIEGKNYGYTVCRDEAELEARVLRLYRDEVIPAVKAGLGGSVYTQITDVEDETNGFYTYDREVCKVNAEKFAKVAAELNAAMEE